MLICRGALCVVVPCRVVWCPFLSIFPFAYPDCHFFSSWSTQLVAYAARPAVGVFVLPFAYLSLTFHALGFTPLVALCVRPAVRAFYPSSTCLAPLYVRGSTHPDLSRCIWRTPKSRHVCFTLCLPTLSCFVFSGLHTSLHFACAPGKAHFTLYQQALHPGMQAALITLTSLFAFGGPPTVEVFGVSLAYRPFAIWCSRGSATRCTWCVPKIGCILPSMYLRCSIHPRTRSLARRTRPLGRYPVHR